MHGALLAWERTRGKKSVYARLPGWVQTALTFLVVCVTWVFFRSPDLTSAVRYLGSMMGLARPQDGAGLLGGVIYQPYYMIVMVLAGAIAFGCPQTWDFTRKITWPKAVLAAAILWLSIAAMTTQAFNPFIYFIF
jgi:alginate O-acetyltransferase complex protein AlgI